MYLKEIPESPGEESKRHGRPLCGTKTATMMMPHNTHLFLVPLLLRLISPLILLHAAASAMLACGLMPLPGYCDCQDIASVTDVGAANACGIAIAIATVTATITIHMCRLAQPASPDPAQRAGVATQVGLTPGGAERRNAFHAPSRV